MRTFGAAKAVAAAWILALMPAAAQAGARVSPMVVNVDPSGRGAVARVTVSNPGQVEFPLEVVMSRGEITEAGELVLTPADEQFLVFPAQARIAANGQQVFRVQYVGEPQLAQSQIYYMSIRQIPVDLGPGTPRVQIVATFNVLVNVVPKGARAEPAVVSVQGVTRDDKPGLEVRLANKGNSYFSASELSWSISGTTASGTAVRLTPSRAEMANNIGVGVVAPGKTRTFFVPTEQSLTGATVALKSD
jgi:fimbrial chaperone protein